MLLLKDKFKLQSIKVDQEDDQKADQDLTQIQNKNRTVRDLSRASQIEMSFN